MAVSPEPLQPSVLVVVERDAACTLWMPHWGPQPETWSVLEQEPGEHGSCFDERLELTLGRHRWLARSPLTLVFVLGPSTDAVSAAERWDRACSFLSHLAALPRSLLVLTSGYGDARARAAHMLEQDLLEDERVPVEIAVRTSRGPSARRAFLAAQATTSRELVA